ncbi:MAG: aspartate-semialdehyde dehydrogenase [Eubacteriaceae bacterium]|nr:aspartate-semialdehyde dehydrogenase [Eubacteriaceae bacterium]
MKSYNIALAGATGVVGRKMIEVLEERNIPIDNFYPLASSRSAGSKITVNDREFTVEELDENSFDRPIDFALFSAGGDVSLKFVPIAARSGAIVIDNSSAFRMDPNVPLVVPEVNAAAALQHNGIIANPNCSTIQAVVALKPIYDLFGIKRIVYTTFQSVSGSGLKGIKDLERGIQGEPNDFYPKPIAYNAIPHIDVFMDEGYTKEELKMVNETRKIFSDDSIGITATCVRIPVLYSHSESINVETAKPFDMQAVMEALRDAEGVVVVDDVSIPSYPTPLEAEGTDLVYVGRVRRDLSAENALNLWCVADNVRKGAATNAVQIAECLIAASELAAN